MQVYFQEQSIDLPDNSTGLDLAKAVKKELPAVALALEQGGVLKDLSSTLQNNEKVNLITFQDRAGKELFWHSSAHILAQAVLRLFPDAKTAIGPSIETGFYYDFANLQVTEEDFPLIEGEMQKIVRERYEPKRIEYASSKEALEQFKDNNFKCELIQSFDEETSAYQQGEFIDLCRGPHIPHTGLVQAFKIMKTSGAYWRANAENEQLTRIYAVSFPDKKELKAYLLFLEEAKKRDHRIIGKQLQLFSFHQEAAGMPFIHPNGMIVWNELLKYWGEEHSKAGYLQIKTPIMLSQELWETSGHWGYYRENMYTSTIDDKNYAIKPMNCPGGMLFFKENQYSYRQLPLRVAEIGTVHRHELSGALSGLFRVRSFHQDDAHIFMKADQMKSEILNVLALDEKIYAKLGLTYHLELSTRPEKSIGSDAMWKMATSTLKDALDSNNTEYIINEGDGAFYGPKIDIHIKDVLGRTWQCGTIQLDFSLPERFNLSYINETGEKERPIMIHRVVYGSIERFLGILIEHFAGKFPLWLAPEHIRILAINDSHMSYAEEVQKELVQAGLRATLDTDTLSINKKVRSAQLQQVPYIAVVGDQEVNNRTLSIRVNNEVLGEKTISQVQSALLEEYTQRLLRRNQI